MPDNLVYMYGKLTKVTEILITNHHDVRERVWVSAKYFSMIHSGGLPESCREDTDWIHHMLTRYPAEREYESSLETTYRRTRNVTAAKIAKRIWKLYTLMECELEARKRT